MRMMVRAVFGIFASFAEGIMCARCALRIISRVVVPNTTILLLNCFGIVFWTSLFWVTMYLCLIRKVRYWEDFSGYLDEDF